MSHATTTSEIVSRANPTFRRLASLRDARGIRRHGLALLAGLRFVREALERRPELCAAWVVAPGMDPPDGPAAIRLSRPLFAELDEAGTRSPLLLLQLPDQPVWKPDENLPGITLLLPFQDPANIGTAIRSAAAFGVGRVVLLAGSAHPFLPRALRASGPAALLLPLLTGPPPGELPARPDLYTLDTAGGDIGRFRPPRGLVLLPGIEGPGLPAHLKGHNPLAIPMSGGVESLNAAAATTVALYCLGQRRLHG